MEYYMIAICFSLDGWCFENPINIKRTLLHIHLFTCVHAFESIDKCGFYKPL